MLQLNMLSFQRVNPSLTTRTLNSYVYEQQMIAILHVEAINNMG
jgi:hypothetical protein